MQPQPTITLSLGAITPSSVNESHPTTIGYLDASSVQTQIDFKLNKSDSISGGYYPATNSKSYLTSYTETDPIKSKINRIVKSNGTTIGCSNCRYRLSDPSEVGKKKKCTYFIPLH